jgi:methylated-DNA-[protein]-cysteine S-methyltransferase
MTLYARLIETPIPAMPMLCAMVDESGALVELDFLPPGGAEAAVARAIERGRRAGRSGKAAGGDGGAGADGGGRAAGAGRVIWDPAPAAEAARQLDEYFRRQRRDFELPLAPRGTAFQLRVWQELQAIPYGAMVSYAELAERVGNPGACRAVGRANGTNPIPVVIPCHRVINAGGALGGYGGGLPVKRALLELEGALLPTS